MWGLIFVSCRCKRGPSPAETETEFGLVSVLPLCRPHSWSNPQSVPASIRQTTPINAVKQDVPAGRVSRSLPKLWLSPLLRPKPLTGPVLIASW